MVYQVRIEIFYVFKQKKSRIDTEFQKYITDAPGETSTLLNMPVFTKLFVRFKTALPASAAVERLFSTGGGGDGYLPSGPIYFIGFYVLKTNIS